jgi:hypothetical protein
MPAGVVAAPPVVDDNLALFCINSGLVAQSMREAQRVFPRWRSRLRQLGIDPADIPPNPLVGATLAQVFAANMVTQFIIQHRKSRANRATAHDVRNVTGIRPPKPPRIRKRRKAH